MLSIGIDVSKGKSTVCGMKPGGEIVYAPFEVQHTREGMSELVLTVSRLSGVRRMRASAQGSAVKATRPPAAVLRGAAAARRRCRRTL